MIVIPAYQAEKTIGPLVQEIVRMGLPVVVVDDASRDATAAQARQAGAHVVRRRINGGKGTALREGISRAEALHCDWILTMDADGQHLVSEIPRFLEAASRSHVDLILGNRMQDPRGMPMERRLTNLWMSWLLSRIVQEPIPDSQCGFRLISASLLKRVNLVCDRFEVESELVVKAKWAGGRIVSIPVRSVYRRSLSFIRPVRDTIRFLRLLFLLCRERPR